LGEQKGRHGLRLRLGFLVLMKKLLFLWSGEREKEMGEKPWWWHPWRSFNNTYKQRLLCSMQFQKVSKCSNHLCNILKKKFTQTCHKILILHLIFCTYNYFKLSPRIRVIFKLPFFQSFFFKMLHSFITYPTYSKDFKDKIFFVRWSYEERKIGETKIKQKNMV
jgi:hypothetical protein